MAHRIGLMGCGSVADFGHLPAIGRCPSFELVALYDPLPGRAHTYAAKFGGTGFEIEDEFFAQKMDAVAVCSPLAYHNENVSKCAEHGLHVLCEKPISDDEDAAADMIAVMEDAKRGFFVGLVYRLLTGRRNTQKVAQRRPHRRCKAHPDELSLESPRPVGARRPRELD